MDFRFIDILGTTSVSEKTLTVISFSTDCSYFDSNRQSNNEQDTPAGVL